MNINNILDIFEYSRTTSANRAGTASSAASFGNMLSAESDFASRAVESRGYVRYMNGNNIFEMDYEDSLGRTQSIRVQYAAESTEHDPVVHISGSSLSGSYSNTVRIRDINLEYATYPELCALLAHENALLMKENGGIGIPVGADDNAAHAADMAKGKLTPEAIMAASNHGDFSEKRNFLQEYAEQFSLDYLTVNIQITSDESKTVTYGDGMSPEQKAAQAKFDQMMKTIDYVIEQQRKQAQEAKEKAEKEELRRIYEAKEYERDLLLKRSDEKKILEDLL
ncbi:MAG: hypothetical protein IJC39_04845 [Firmicutes bacterium]|nr:hypothetical protein [Bacillota bacterium]